MTDAIHKALDVDGDTLDVDDTGIFAGYASTHSIDLDGDVIEAGAWADTLAEDYPDGGAGIPIHWEHESRTPDDIVGQTLSAEEDDKGLYIVAQLDMDTDGGRKAYRLLKKGLVHQMSVGFVPVDSDYIEQTGGMRFRRAKLYEISLVQIAANQEAEILTVKSADTEPEEDAQTAPDDAPEVEAQKDSPDTSDDDRMSGGLDRLESLLDRLDSVLAAAGDGPDGKADCKDDDTDDADAAEAKAEALRFLGDLGDKD